MNRLGQSARFGLLFLFILVAGALAPVPGKSAPFAAMVMDARTGEIIHSQNAETRLHPASLTKMMTLYIAFQAIQRGEISLDTEVRITAAAAAEPPSKLGLREGQTIRLRYLLRAAAVKSATDAATAIGLAVSGSQEAFAQRMNATAQAMGMSNTNFRNMHGLTMEGHYSTAHDMTVLGRHIIYDYPQYYNLFSRRSADAGIAEVANTNRRFLDAYPGADGIKTGFTNAAGYNLVASAQRGQVRIIATVFGGTSTANRNARVAELLDMGFAQAPARANVRQPDVPQVAAGGSAAAPVIVASNVSADAAGDVPGAAGRTIRVTGQVMQALRPMVRPGTDTLVAGAEPELNSVSSTAVDDALAIALGLAPAPEPAVQQQTASQPVEIAVAMAVAEPVAPQMRPIEMVMTASAEVAEAEVVASAEGEVITRVSTSGGRHWGINLGRYNSHNEAERVLIQIVLSEMDTLEGGLRRISQLSGGFDANVMGLSREDADLACRRLQARGTTCFMVGTDES